VLAAHRFFWPDTPAYASILRRIGENWVADGHAVEVVSAQPSYNAGPGQPSEPARENLNGLLVRRTALPPERSRRSLARKINFGLFPLKLAFHILTNRRYDLVMVSTFPPVVMGIVTAVAARLRGARFVYHCMDIHPEGGRLAGEFGRPWVYRLLRALDSQTCRMAERVVVLSEDMRRTLQSRPRPISSDVIDVRPNFVIPSYADEIKGQPPGVVAGVPLEHGERFRILFAGNIGRFQGLDGLLEGVIALPEKESVELIFVGDGAARAALEDKASSAGPDRVRFVGQQPIASTERLVRSADLCVVSLMPGVYRCAYPTKTMTYLHEARPLLAIVEDESVLSRQVREEELGVAVPPGETERLTRELSELINDPQRLTRMKVACQRIYERDYAEARSMEYWSRLARELS